MAKEQIVCLNLKAMFEYLGCRERVVIDDGIRWFGWHSLAAERRE
jgi:hypothetical protein